MTTQASESERYLSRPKAADYLGVSTRLLDRWISDGLIPVVKAGRRVLADRADLDRFYGSLKKSDSGPK
jgi:excisionase family DNA binding protein